MKQKAIFVLLAILFFASCNDSSTGRSDENPLEKSQNIKSEEYFEDESLFPNPERGWYVHFRWNDVVGDEFTVRRLVKFREKENLTQLFTIYYLTKYIDKPLSEEFLALLQSNFDILRESGSKAVLRFAYSEDSTVPVRDAAPEVVLQHIKQLAPILHKNVDVVSVLEAGFIGTWGEWYYTTNYTDSIDPNYTIHKQIANSLLEALPKERMISLRTPHYKTRILDITSNSPLTLAEAYNQTPKARLSHHNDCFLADATDVGTYKNEESKVYTAHDSKYVCVGGETCRPSTYSECDNAIKMMEKYHWSYINRSYRKEVTGGWVQNGCYDEIERRLGYRFVLKTLQHPESVSSGGKFELKFTVENVGFAAPYNPRSCRILFRSKSGEIVYKQELQADPRFWFAGETQEIKEIVNLPTNLAAGDYDVLLLLYDPQPSISERPEYAIRLANKNVWEKETGYNKLFIQKIH